MLRKLLTFFDQNAYRREVERYAPLLRRVNHLEPQTRQLSDSALRGTTDQLKKRLQGGEPSENLIPEAFAAVREAAWRTIGLRHFDVQVIGGIVLQRGAIAELRTGEGKTLAATLPLYLTGLQEKGAHLVTVNDYLARRDARWMGPVFHFLGLSVGVLQADEPGSPERQGYLFDSGLPAADEKFNFLRQVSRAQAYSADITYGTNSEFGFDYLRDNLVRRLEQKAQRSHHYAIVDEVDNILIDEARTPLIISGENSSQVEWYNRMAAVVDQLGQHEVEINRREQSVTLQPAGEKHVSVLLGMPLIDPRHPEEASPEQRHLLGHLEQALRARFLYQRDHEYVIQDGKVVIVDEFTGRMMPGRRWTDGLHQAVEAREGLEVQSESITYATISLQNYFRMYQVLSGMTGTALSASPEFEKIYRLRVHPIPTHVEYQALNKNDALVERQAREGSGPGRPGQPFTYYTSRDDPLQAPLFWKRLDYPDVLYLKVEAKQRAIAWEILGCHARGQPLLVGTTSVADSEDLARRLDAGMLLRLAQVQLLRQAHPSLRNDLPEENFKFLEAPLGLIGPKRMQQAFESLKLEADPLAKIAELMQLLNLLPECQETLKNDLQSGIPNTVLNARYHYEESQIIASAGAPGSVVIATNMAGRGVDIKLGGELAEEVLLAVNRLLERHGTPQPYSMSLAERLNALQKLSPQQVGEFEAEANYFSRYVQDMERVKKLGGLRVIGSTRHEARRIDYQLRGRAARQGDPGSSRTFISMEDDLMVRFSSLEGEALLEQEEQRGGDVLLPVPYEAGKKVIEAAQRRVENENFEIREHLLEYDDVINGQRLAIYEQRDRILSKPDLSGDLAEMLEDELELRLEKLQAVGVPQAWQLIDWAGRLQPSLKRPDGSLYPSWPLQVVSGKALADVQGEVEPARVRETLLMFAGQALEAERRFILEQADRLCENALEKMRQAVDSRMETVDAFLDSLDLPQVARQPGKLMKGLSAAAGMPVQISAASIQTLEESLRPAALEVFEQVETALLQEAEQQVTGDLENWLGSLPKPAPGSTELVEGQDLYRRAAGSVQAAFEARQERLLEPGGKLASALDSALGKCELPLGEAGILDMLELMQVSRHGRDAAVPPAEAGQMVAGPGALIEIRSGEKQAQSAAVLDNPRSVTYVFLAEELLAGVSIEDIASQALEHLLGAQQALKDDLGNQDLSEFYRQVMLECIDERWLDYLTSLEELRYEVRLEGMAHNDPLVIYKSKASQAYSRLLADLRSVSVALMFQPLAAAGMVGTSQASASEKPAPRLTYLKLG